MPEIAAPVERRFKEWAGRMRVQRAAGATVRTTEVQVQREVQREVQGYDDEVRSLASTSEAAPSQPSSVRPLSTPPRSLDQFRAVVHAENARRKEQGKAPLPPVTGVHEWDGQAHTGSTVELPDGGLAVHTGRGRYQALEPHQRLAINVEHNGISLNREVAALRQRGQDVRTDRAAAARR